MSTTVPLRRDERAFRGWRRVTFGARRRVARLDATHAVAKQRACRGTSPEVVTIGIPLPSSAPLERVPSPYATSLCQTQVSRLQEMLEAKQLQLRAVLSGGAGGETGPSPEERQLEQQREEYGRRGIRYARLLLS